MNPLPRLCPQGSLSRIPLLPFAAPAATSTRYRRGLLMAWAASLLLVSVTACKSQEEKDQEQLNQTVAQLRGTDFGDSWTSAMASLADLADSHREVPASAAISSQARLWRARAQLALFITALVTEDDALFTQWKTERGWKLEGKLSDLINFQSTIQEIAGDIDLIQADGGLSEQDHAIAGLIAQFARTTQGVFYRDKRQYIKGGLNLRKVPELAWMDDAMALRDLIVETTRRPGPGVDKNWQNAVLTVFGRVCGEVASKHVANVCTVAKIGEPQEYCPEAWEKQAQENRVAGAVLLLTNCKCDEAGAEGLRGAEAVRFYYDAAFNRLTSSGDAPAPLVAWAKEHREAMNAAYAEIEKTLLMGLTQDDLRKVDEKKLMESLLPSNQVIDTTAPSKKAPSNKPKGESIHGHDHEHGH